MKIDTAAERMFGPMAEATGPVAVSAVSALRPIGGAVSGSAQAEQQAQPGREDDDARQLQQATEALDEYFGQREPALNFRVDDDTGRLIVSLVDPSSGEVLRQIPGEEVLRMARALQDGEPPLVDQRV